MRIIEIKRLDSKVKGSEKERAPHEFHTLATPTTLIGQKIVHISISPYPRDIWLSIRFEKEGRGETNGKKEGSIRRCGVGYDG